MGAGTPLRSASVAGSVGDGPDADGTALGVVRTAAAGAQGRGGEGGPVAAVESPRRTARPSAPAYRATRRGRPVEAELRGGARGFAVPPVGPFEGRGSTGPGWRVGERERLSAALAAAGLAAPPGPRPEGTTLDHWVAERLGRSGDPGVPWPDARPVATALVGLIARVHALGAALCDLSAEQVLVGPDGRLRLAGPRPYPAPRPGAVSLRRGPYGDDRHALGGLLFLLATGRTPLLAEEFPEARAGTPPAAPAAVRLRRWLALAARTGETARRLTPLVLGLCAEDPADRWPPERAAAALGPPSRISPGVACPARSERKGPVDPAPPGT
ncbi:hypothetical protein BX265_4919 [Streptomyces sp. TLI_235]|nr:hypothetical protein [Streptomyces sp. TLI_235]PBC80084.1 hypothetical protein BX265_4919 [Streptomyces sp. TLI_235]